MPNGEPEQRKLAAIMFTDMVGYSALAQRNEALALELLEEHRRLLRAIFPQHHGLEIETAGDAFLVEFVSALEAVRCAVEIQEQLSERNPITPSERAIRLRIGIHVGDVVHKDGKVMGDAVNIAARIEPLAAAGGICISNAVYEQVRNKLEQTFTSLGPAELKNIELPVAVYRVVLPWEKAVEANSSGTTRSTGARVGSTVDQGVWSRRTSILALLATAVVVITTLALGWKFVHQRKTSPPATIRKSQWQPPELPPGCTNVTILGGGLELNSSITNSPIGTEMTILKLGDYSFPVPYQPVVEGNRFYVFARIGDVASRYYRILMTNSWDAVLPPRWDRNFSDHEYEVVRDDLVPVLQVVYRRANVIEIKGVFSMGTNQTYIVTGDAIEIWTGNEEQNVIAYVSEKRRFVFIPKSAPEPVDTPAAQEATPTAGSVGSVWIRSGRNLKDLKRIFKYPSHRHLGEYAD